MTIRSDYHRYRNNGNSRSASIIYALPLWMYCLITMLLGVVLVIGFALDVIMITIAAVL